MKKFLFAIVGFWVTNAAVASSHVPIVPIPAASAQAVASVEALKPEAGSTSVKVVKRHQTNKAQMISHNAGSVQIVKAVKSAGHVKAGKTTKRVVGKKTKKKRYK